jgi:hypothetical protein
MTVDTEKRVIRFDEKPAAPAADAGPRRRRARLDGHLHLQAQAARAAAGGGRLQPGVGARLRPQHHPVVDPHAHRVRLSVPGRAHARAELLARRRQRGCLLRREPRARARLARAQPLRRAVADLDLPGAAAAREVRARRRRPARHGGQLHGVRRLHHFRRRGARVAAVLARAGGRARGDRAFGGAAQCAHRTGLPHPPRHHRRGLRRARGHVIGHDPVADAARFHVSPRGVVLVTAGMLRRET